MVYYTIVNIIYFISFCFKFTVLYFTFNVRIIIFYFFYCYFLCKLLFQWIQKENTKKKSRFQNEILCTSLNENQQSRTKKDSPAFIKLVSFYIFTTWKWGLVLQILKRLPKYKRNLHTRVLKHTLNGLFDLCKIWEIFFKNRLQIEKCVVELKLNSI